MTREEQVDWLCRLKADLNNGVIFTPWNKEFTEALTDILEKESILDKIRTVIDAECRRSIMYPNWERAKALEWVLGVIDKYKVESEGIKMTLDESIKHAEEVADYDAHGEKQCKCAEEHRQLSEWLKDYKRLKEQELKTEQFAKWVATEIFDDVLKYVYRNKGGVTDKNIYKVGDRVEVMSHASRHNGRRGVVERVLYKVRFDDGSDSAFVEDSLAKFEESEEKDGKKEM